jgi:hypothetical protein
VEDIVAGAKAEYLRAKDRVIRALATTPDDKINWSPSPTSRTPVQLVAHAAIGVDLTRGLLEAKPFPYESAAAFDVASRRLEKEYTTREQALGILEHISAEYLAWLDTLTPAQLASTVETAFGPIKMTPGITLGADHLRNHAAQIEYLQTVWGDTDWHL